MATIATNLSEIMIKSKLCYKSTIWTLNLGEGAVGVVDIA
jgi:hypothetical protein